MNDNVKTGVAVGGVVAVIGLLASYLCYKEGHAGGHSKGLSKRDELHERKYADLERRFKDQVKYIQELQVAKQQIQSDHAVFKDAVRELCNNLKGRVSDEAYQKIITSLHCNGTQGLAGIIDDATDELKYMAEVRAAGLSPRPSPEAVAAAYMESDQQLEGTFEWFRC